MSSHPGAEARPWVVGGNHAPGDGPPPDFVFLCGATRDSRIADASSTGRVARPQAHQRRQWIAGVGLDAEIRAWRCVR